MSHNAGYGQSNRVIKASLGGSSTAGKNVKPTGSNKKNVLPKLLSQSQETTQDKSDSSGLDVGVCTVQGRRPYQEDQYAVCRFLKDPQGSNENTPETHYFGVFDGHAGGKCSKAICSTIPYQFCRDESFSTKLPVALKRAIQKTNEQFLEVAGRMRLNDGSTAVQIAIRGKTMTIANVGDSRAVLISGKKGIQLTEDHKPSLPSEHRRIASFGGTVTYNTGIARVAGVLAVSRAFGNYTIRNLIRADPDVTQRELTEQDHYLVLASDGLWDVFRAAEVADICYTYERHGVQRIADYLVQMSLTRGSMDNVTAVVVSLSRYYNRMTQLEASGGATSLTPPSQIMSARMRPPPEENKQRDNEITNRESLSSSITTSAHANPYSSASTNSTLGSVQRPASSGGAGMGVSDKDRQHARPQGSTAKSRPSSGYAAFNSNTSYTGNLVPDHGVTGISSSSGAFSQQRTPTEIFDDEETLGDLSEFNKSVDFSALNNHVNGVGQFDSSSTPQGGRMHQRIKSQSEQNSFRSTIVRPRSSQQAVKQSSDTGGSVNTGLFGDLSSTPSQRPAATQEGQAGQRQQQQYMASPSNIMKRMFSRGKNQDAGKQMFSNIGEDGQVIDDSKANSNGHSQVHQTSQVHSTGDNTQHSSVINSSSYKRPGSAMSGINNNSSSGGGSATNIGGGNVVGVGGVSNMSSGAGTNRANKVTYTKGALNKNYPLVAFTGGAQTIDQNNVQVHNSSDNISRAGASASNSAVERVQNMGYSKGLHSPINTKLKK